MTPFGAVGGSALTPPAPLKGSPGSEAGGTRKGNTPGQRVTVALMDGQTDRGSTGTPAAAQIP